MRRARGRVTVERFCREPLLVRESGLGTRTVVEKAFAERGLAWRPYLELGSTEVIKGAVAADVGVAFVSNFAVAPELTVGRLAVIPIAGLNLRCVLYLVRVRGKQQTIAETTFLDLLHTSLCNRPDKACRTRPGSRP